MEFLQGFFDVTVAYMHQNVGHAYQVKGVIWNHWIALKIAMDNMYVRKWAGIEVDKPRHIDIAAADMEPPPAVSASGETYPKVQQTI